MAATCLSMGGFCLGTDVVGGWLTRILNRLFTGPLVLLIREYVDDSDLFWVREHGGDKYTFKLMATTSDRVRSTTSDRVLTTYESSFDSGGMFPLLYDGPRKMVTFMLRKNGQTTIVTKIYDPSTDKMDELVSPSFNYEFSAFPIDGAPNLIINCRLVYIPGTRYSYYSVPHVFNTLTMMPSCAMQFKSDDIPDQCHAARIDVKTGSILIGGIQTREFCDYQDRIRITVWRHTCANLSTKVVDVSDDGKCMTVFLAANFFGGIFYFRPLCSGIRIWTYTGLLVPDYHNNCPLCRNDTAYYTPLISNDTIYYLRYNSAGSGSYWCKYRPLAPLSPTGAAFAHSHGPLRHDLPNTVFPYRLQFSGQFILEHYEYEHILVLTHIDTFVYRILHL
jgi:hypothetical protein